MIGADGGRGRWPADWRAGLAGWRADRWSVDWRAGWTTAKVLHLCAFLALRQIDRLADGRHQNDYRDQGNRADGISVSDPVLADLMDQLANRLQAHGEAPASSTLSRTLISIRSLVPMTRRT